MRRPIECNFLAAHSEKGVHSNFVKFSEFCYGSSQSWSRIWNTSYCNSICGVHETCSLEIGGCSRQLRQLRSGSVCGINFLIYLIGFIAFKVWTWSRDTCRLQIIFLDKIRFAAFSLSDFLHSFTYLFALMRISRESLKKLLQIIDDKKYSSMLRYILKWVQKNI